MKKNNTIFKKTILLGLFLCSLISCENKRDINGDLDGMWQMIEWKNENGITIKDKKSRIFYNVQLKLIQFRDFNESAEKKNVIHTYFRHTPDSLIIFHPVNYGTGQVIPLSDLKKYGVPEDGGFHIDALNENNMILSSEEGTLYFRKF